MLVILLRTEDWALAPCCTLTFNYMCSCKVHRQGVCCCDNAYPMSESSGETVSFNLWEPSERMLLFYRSSFSDQEVAYLFTLTHNQLNIPVVYVQVLWMIREIVKQSGGPCRQDHNARKQDVWSRDATDLYFMYLHTVGRKDQLSGDNDGYGRH